MKSKVEKLTLIDLIFPLPSNKIFSLLREFILIFSFSILTGICAKLKIEIGPVPITMQTFAILLSGAILGSVRGSLSQISYLLFGLLGIPWFSRGGGMSYILSPTFGYILGFILCSFFVGFLFERGWGKSFKNSILAMAIGNLILYIPGLLWLAKFVGPKEVLAVGLFPFLIGDVLKIILAGSILHVGYKLVKK